MKDQKDHNSDVFPEWKQIKRILMISVFDVTPPPCQNRQSILYITVEYSEQNHPYGKIVKVARMILSNFLPASLN